MEKIYLVINDRFNVIIALQHREDAVKFMDTANNMTATKGYYLREIYLLQNFSLPEVDKLPKTEEGAKE